MASSAGSDIFFASSFLVICLLVLLLIRYYLPIRTSPLYLLLPVFLSLALPTSLILLVPIDLASSTGADSESKRGIWLRERLLLVSWRIAYWLTFSLTWAILPLLGEYCDSGYRDPQARLIYSTRQNSRYQLTVLGCGAFGAVYVITQSGFNFVSIRALVMALAYAWGLILAIYLMGHGLVAIPKRLFRDASVSGRLRKLQEQAPKTYERMTDAVDELLELEAQVHLLQRRSRTGTAKEFGEWIMELAETSGEPEALAAPSASSARTSGGSGVPNVITERFMADLTRKLKRARHKRARFTDEWARLVAKAARTEAILDSACNKSLDFKSRPGASTDSSSFTALTPRARYHLYTHVLPAASIALGAVLSLASASIIWSELVKQSLRKASIINLTVITHVSGESRHALTFGNQIVAALWLTYMCAAALYSITEVTVWGNRTLVRRQTYPESACWYAGQVAKLTVPLAYNFAEMVEPSVFKGTVFYQFLGKLVDLTPLGKGFSEWFPIFVLVPVLASVFGLYGKVRTWTGFGRWVMADDEEDEAREGTALVGSGSWREGQSLIARELNAGTAVAGAVGLFSRDASPSKAGSRRPGWETDGRSAGPARASAPSSTSRRPLGDRYQGGAADRPGAKRNRDDGGDEEVDAGFFSGFAHRIRNTFDTTPRPAWMDNLRPPWTDRGGGAGGDRTETASSWFGGRARDGQVRL